MARKLIVEILGDSRSLENAYKRSSRAGKQWSSDLSHTARGVAVAQVGFRGLGRSLAFASGGFIAGAGISAGIKAVVSDASDLNEEVNKSNVVFGKSAKMIQSWSKTTADASGIARASALSAAGGFGSILETSGLTEKASAGMSKSLVNLAGDLASFNNISTDDALEKLRSGLVGEAEPLRTVGVLLSESRVKAEAYRSGIAKQGATLTDAQKVQARYNIILADTARQQGDFARTSGGLANASRRVKASITDIAASIGSAVLPALARGTSAFADFLGDLQKAKGVKAKLNVAIDFGRQIGAGAVDLVRNLENAIDHALSTFNFEAGTRILFNRAREALGRVDWAGIGRLVGDRLINALSALTAIIQGIDWGIVGRGIIRGIVAFIKGVDWVGLVKVIVRLLVAAIKAVDSLLIGAGKELAKALWQGIKAGLGALSRLIEIEALKVALAILRPLDFTILGRHIIPGLDTLIGNIETKLEKLATSAEGSAKRVGAALNAMTDHGPAEPGAVTTPTTPTPTVTVPTPTVTVPDPTTTKATETALEKAQKAFAKVIDALNFKAQKAAATRTIKDDIRAQEAINDAIRKEIGVEGKTTDLARQLFEGRQKLVDLAVQQRTQNQFKALGLTATGDTPPPSVGTLKRRVASLREALKGTVFDTAKTRTELRHIASVLAGAFGKTTVDIRNAIKGMLDGIASSLSGGGTTQTGPLTKFAKHGVEGLVKGLNLTAAQVKEVRQRFSQFNRLDLASAGGGAVRATGRRDDPRARREPGGRGREEPIILHVFIDGKEVESTVTRRQQKTRGRNAPRRRGVPRGA